MDLNTILIILGILALIALVAHGLWSNRREKSQYFQNANAFSHSGQALNSTPHNGPYNKATSVAPTFTQPKQAVIHQEPPVVAEPSIASTQQTLNFENYHDDHLQSAQDMRPDPQSVDQIKITLPNVDVAPIETAPVYEMRPSTARVQGTSNAQYYPQNASVQPQPVQNLAQQSIADIEANMDLDEGINSSSELLRVQLQEASQAGNQVFAQSPISKAPLQQPIEVQEEPVVTVQEQATLATDENSEFVMLYVVAPENREFHGVTLVQVLEDLGFIYGEGSIYHRHLDLTVASPVLFSAANITQPGTFNPYALQELYTVGVAIFMRLPSPGNNLTNLKIMMRAAKTLAEQLGGFVLTEQQELLTEASEQEYFDRVK
ncbi:cell division protein ZipA [Mannheimia massilioguelmaensis]|uniref:cell division protein ZipA n=1 Tax=Mannheimia massilioguelmaensis TaxID=1604354 RepID=UPI0005C8AB04|nr:cell division protein ZipA [Mannheimia massilioguelmaensis]